MSTYTSVVISPETTTSPVFTSVSQATRPAGSSAITASRTLSEIWSAILSGCPSVTDSDVKRNSLALMARKATGGALLDAQEEGDLQLVRPPDGVLDGRAKRLQVPADPVRDPRVRDPLESRNRAVDVDIEDGLRLRRQRRAP